MAFVGGLGSGWMAGEHDWVDHDPDCDYRICDMTYLCLMSEDDCVVSSGCRMIVMILNASGNFGGGVCDRLIWRVSVCVRRGIDLDRSHLVSCYDVSCRCEGCDNVGGCGGGTDRC